MSIPKIVAEILENKPFIIECLLLDIINFNGLASLFKSDIEKITGKKVNLLTISMALRRYVNELKSHPLENLLIDPKTDLTSKTNLIEVTFRQTPSSLLLIEKLSNQIIKEQERIYSLVFGTENITILVNKKFQDTIINSLEKYIMGMKVDLGAIFMTIPPEYRDQKGFFYTLTRKLAYNNINILSLANIDTEVLFVFYNEEVPNAFRVLFNLIH